MRFIRRLAKDEVGRHHICEYHVRRPRPAVAEVDFSMRTLLCQACVDKAFAQFAKHAQIEVKGMIPIV